MERQLLKTASWNLLRLLGRQGGYSLFLLLAALFLAPDEIGRAALALGLAYLARLPVHRGLRDYLLAAGPFPTKEYRTLVLMNCGLGCLLTIGLILPAVGLSIHFEDKGLLFLCLLAAPIPLLASLHSVQEGSLEKAFLQMELARYQVEAALLATLVCLPAIFLVPSAFILIVFCVLESLVIAIRTIWSAGFPIGGGFCSERAKKALRFSFPVMANALLSGGHVRFLQVLVGVLFGLHEAGLYRIATQIFQLLVQFSLSPVSEALYPVFAANRRRPELIYRRASILVCSFAYPLFFGVCAANAVLVEAFAAPEWQGLAQVIVCFAFLAPARVLAFVTSPILTMEGRARLIFLTEVSALVLAVSALATGSMISSFMLAIAVYCAVTGIPWILTSAVFIKSHDIRPKQIVCLHGISGGPAFILSIAGLLSIGPLLETKDFLSVGIHLGLVIALMVLCWSISGYFLATRSIRSFLSALLERMRLPFRQS